MANNHPTPTVSSRLEQSVDTLLHASLAPSSRAHYQRAWNKLVDFFKTVGTPLQFPVSVTFMLLFIAHLHGLGFAPQSISSIISALAYFHKVNGFCDPSNNFIVAKALSGARNLRHSCDVRLPITLPILTQLIEALPHVFHSHYKCILLRAMMVLAFRAYLRVGEMVPRSKQMLQSCLQVDDILVVGDLITLSFRRFKHSGKQGPQAVQVRGEHISNSAIYPARFALEFLSARGNVAGPLFSNIDHSPLLRSEFDAALKRLLNFCGFSSEVFKGHSFRIGAATFVALNGESDAKIRVAGRWQSDAFRKYIRIA